MRGLGLSTGSSLDAIEPTSAQPVSDDDLADRQAASIWLGRPDIVSIAALHGQVVGTGFQLALACDLRILADDTQLAVPEVTLGVVPYLGATKILVDMVGYHRALELCLTGRRIGASEAARLGLADLIVGLAELDAAVGDLVQTVLSVPRDAAIEIKALLKAAPANSRSEQLAAERQAQIRRVAALGGEGD